MASGVYKRGIQGLIAGDIDLDTDTIRAVLIDSGTYTVNLATHQDYADLSGIVGTESGAFTTVSVTNGVFDADNLTFSSVTGASVEAIVIFLDTGVAANDLLIAYIDGFTAVTPNGGDITVTWGSHIIDFDS